MGIDRSNIPDEYMCERCQPRHVDRQHARTLQLRKREELLNTDSSSDTSSSTDTDGGKCIKFYWNILIFVPGLYEPNKVALFVEPFCGLKTVMVLMITYFFTSAPLHYHGINTFYF